MSTLSIITACYNVAGLIGDCLESIGEQTHAAGHILIDGASTDGTLDIIAERGSAIAKFVSEPDRGVYDAMNKGIALATGEVIGTLNADDLYAHPGVLARVAEAFEDPEFDCVYGDLDYVRREDPSQVVRAWRSGPFDPGRFWWGWMPPHPTFFVRRRVYERCGAFDLGLGTSADYELMLRFLVRHGIRAAYIPEVLVKMRTGGVSNATLANRIQANRMDRRAWEVNGLKPYPWTLWLKPLRKVAQYFVK